METSGVLDSSVLDSSVLLRLRKVTATRQLKADHSLTKPPRPKYGGACRGKKRRLGQKRK